MGDFRGKVSIVIDADEGEVGLEDGLIVAAHAVIVSAITELIVLYIIFFAEFL